MTTKAAPVSHPHLKQTPKKAQMIAPRASKNLMSCSKEAKVGWWGDIADFKTQTEPISCGTFQELMDEEPDKPFFTLARVHSGSGEHRHERLYSAGNIINWYPLAGRADPCTRGNIDKIEYYLHMKGEGGVIHVGDVHGKPRAHVSKSADYFIWSHTAEDEPSKMLALLAMAYLQNLGLKNFTSADTFDTSSLLQLCPEAVRSPEQENVDRSNGKKIIRYIVDHITKMIEQGEFECSDPGMLLASIKHDAAHHLARILVSQDPNINESSEDFARQPHIRTNALTTAIIRDFEESLVAQGAGSADPNKDAPAQTL